MSKLEGRWWQRGSLTRDEGDGEEEAHPMDFRGGVLNGCGPVTGEPPELGREVEAKGVSRASWLGPCKQREMKGKRR